MINFILRIATLGLLGKVKKINVKFEDTNGYNLWYMIAGFGGFLTLQENKKIENKIMVVTHPNIVAIVYNALFSLVLSITVLGLTLTITELKDFKKYDATTAYMVYLVTMFLAAGVWSLIILGSIFGPEAPPEPALRQLF